MKYPSISRRTALKGIGSVTIGLPILEEMCLPVSAAEAEKIPVRAFNVFFGLGIPAPLLAFCFALTIPECSHYFP